MANLLKAEVAVEYFPIWKEPEKLANVLLTLKDNVGRRAGLMV